MKESRINKERLFQEFITLAEIDSPSLKERELADYLKNRLQDLGFTVEEDDTAAKISGSAGNLLARLPGAEGLSPLFFACHMDTVTPGEGVEVLFEDGVFRSKGNTVLGGDDKAGIASLLEVLEMLREHEQPHCPLEILLTVGEEHGLLGSKNFDIDKLTSKMGYVLDSTGTPGTIITAAPAQNVLYVTVRGKAAHAGFEPERGVNAIKIASDAISRLRLGRIDEETTSNIGIIEGGKATNIVPDAVFIQGETRSLDRGKLDALTEEIIGEFERVKEIPGASSNIRVDFEYPEYRLDPEQEVVRFASEAIKRTGLEARLEISGGGSDANILNAAGLAVANLAVGMQNAHTTDEFLESQHLIHMVQILWEMIQLSVTGK
ncbi:MAG TPA: M20/M25/M40 family metallo-hydrolase [Syntrophomonadaceae bacterium]|nr:M20/M25/M40 family metallo-hydrolase [Syntrophomonadaceae bacterium]